MKIYNTEEFLKLNSEWQQKLAASGFDDIEASEASETTVTKQEFIPVKRSTKRAAIIAALLETESVQLEKYRYGAHRGQLKLFQLDILRLYADGRTPEEIAQEVKRLHPTNKSAHINTRAVQMMINRFIKQAMDRVNGSL